MKDDLWVTSPSGGTELCAGLVGGCPLLPVYAGEIQTRLLGMDVHAWNDAGEEVIGEVGELVVTSPSPSMPLRFMNDPSDARYRETYFEHFPGVWRHGDFIKINERGGCYIYGRSDSTLNRYGVRIGSAEIYRAVEQLDEIADSLIVCLELPGGAFYMPLFVRVADGAVFDDALSRPDRDQAAHRLQPAPRPRRDPPRRRDPVHAHRQEDGDPGPPHPRRNAAGKGREPRSDDAARSAGLVRRLRPSENANGMRKQHCGAPFDKLKVTWEHGRRIAMSP